MEMKDNLAYLRARKKVEVLKGFYQHLIAYLIINLAMVFVLANVFSSGKTDFSNVEVYFIAIFWGIGLVSHAIYVLFEIHLKIKFLRRWEERKIRQFMDDDEV